MENEGSEFLWKWMQEEEEEKLTWAVHTIQRFQTMQSVLTVRTTTEPADLQEIASEKNQFRPLFFFFFYTQALLNLSRQHFSDKGAVSQQLKV